MFQNTFCLEGYELYMRTQRPVANASLMFSSTFQKLLSTKDGSAYIACFIKVLA